MLVTKIKALATAIGVDIKSLVTKVTILENINRTDKVINAASNLIKTQRIMTTEFKR